jgi:glutaredoxin
MIQHKTGAMGRLAVTMVAMACLLVAGCNKPDAESVEQAAAATIPKPPPVMPEGGPYTLRFFSAVSGELVTVKKPADVPEGARLQVLVTYEDPALQGPWVYVADLSGKADPAKGYAVTSVDRAELESQVAAAKPAPTAAAPGAESAAGSAPQAAGAATTDNDVIIYRTTWCGYCKKAAEYLKLKGVPFVEKDLERDPGARADMLARAQKAGVPASQLQGVPIMAVKGKVFPGFDRGAIDRALAGR